jgi:hypothetical protein
MVLNDGGSWATAAFYLQTMACVFGSSIFVGRADEWDD